MTRFVPVTVLLVLLAGTRVAGAQATGGDTLPSGAKIVFEKRAIFDPSKADDANPFTEPQAASSALFHFFNLAHCRCAKLSVTTAKGAGNFQYLVHASAASGASMAANIDFWVGSSCTDSVIATRDMNCLKLSASNSVTSSIADIDNTPQRGDTREFNLFQVVNGKLHAADLDCVQDNNVSAPIYAFVRALSATPSDDYDAKTSISAGTLSTDGASASGVDTQPPPFPTAIKAAGGERAIHLSWTPPSANASDIAFYQALCAKLPSEDAPDGDTAKLNASNAAQYVTAASLCNATGDPAPTPVAVTNPQAAKEQAAGAPTGEFLALHQDFICGQSDSGTASSLDITGLENKVPYRVILVSADLHGNYTAGYFTTTVTPIESTDFWEDATNRDHQLEGGLCLLAETYGDDGGVTRLLRGFRDDTLGGSQAGRWLIDAYYATLGKLGGAVHGSLALRIAAAIALAPVVGFALLWHWLTLPGLLGLLAAAWWLRRRPAALRGWLRRTLVAARPRAVRGVAIAVALGVIGLGAGRAHAGAGYQPYWEDNDPINPENQDASAERVEWHVGVRIGPYVPDVDSRFDTSMGPGPYEQMYGNGQHILTMLDVDRVLWSGFGQLGVGLSLGYWQKTARAFAADSKATDPERARTADINKFRLVPSALTATYRLTWFDDEYGVPVVPYARGGLAYYLWWVNTAEGSIAKSCVGGLMASPCTTTKGIGGSLGVTGSIGLAIRAERIDSSAAMSMRQSGIQHAGIYAELSLAKVDGFGSDKKLSVGDTTWFAGVDFEF